MIPKFLKLPKAGTIATFFLGLLFFVLLLTLVIRGGYYPVALAHGDWIKARDFWRDYNASLTYYRETGTLGRLTNDFDPEFRSEIARASLERLVENALIKRGLGELVGRKESARLVAEKLNSENTNSPILAEATSKLYKITAEEFIKMVGLPKARQDVLIDSLQNSQESFESWEKDVKSRATIIVFDSRFDWDGDSVVVISKKVDN